MVKPRAQRLIGVIIPAVPRVPEPGGLPEKLESIYEYAQIKCKPPHAFAELSVNAGLVLVSALSEPALDFADVPVQLLREAIQMPGVWVLEPRGHTDRAADTLILGR